MVIKTAQKTITQVLPKTLAILVTASIIAWMSTWLVDMITSAGAGMGDLAVLIISTIVSLGLFVGALGLKGAKKFDTITEIIPLIIVAPLAVAILGQFDVTLPIVGSEATFANLGMVVASAIFAVSLLKQTGIKMFK